MQTLTDKTLFEKGCLSRLEKAHKTANFENKKKLEELKQIDRYVEVNIPVEMDDGNLKFFQGFRCQHNMFRGPYKGGIRFHPQVSLDEVKSLSFWMTIKNAIVGIPFGGSKGGVIANPSELSKKEIENLSRGYVRRMHPVIGPQFDIPAPDVNTNGKIMDIMVDEYKKYNPINFSAAFTGKTLENGGVSGRKEATGYGGAFLLDHYLKKDNKSDSTLKIAIQGFGNVSQYFCLQIQKLGHSIVAITDSKGGVYNKDGIDINSAIDYKLKYKTLKDFPDCENISNEALFKLKVDLLVPSALEGVINKNNYLDIEAKIILEMANGPVDYSCEELLKERGVIILPDVLCNAGGVCVSYLEWKQNLENKKLSENEVFQILGDYMRKGFDDVYSIKESYKTDFKNAAYILAISRLIN